MGVKRAKPTDFFGRFPDTWTPRAPCKNHTYDAEGNKTNTNCDHESARRRMQNTGTAGLKNNKIRSMVPRELCEEIADAVREAIL